MLVAVAVVAAACSQPPGTVTDAGTWGEADACPTILFIGARGTDQPAGLGPQLDDAPGRILAVKLTHLIGLNKSPEHPFRRDRILFHKVGSRLLPWRIAGILRS